MEQSRAEQAVYIYRRGKREEEVNEITFLL
jgi:hypothetical protein